MSLILRAQIQQWQAGTEHNDDPGQNSPCARLCSECIDLYREAVGEIVSKSNISKHIRISLERSFGLLVLWSEGYGVSEGNLDDLLAKSRKLRRAILQLLRSICNTLTKRLIPLATISSERLGCLSLHVKSVVEEVAYNAHDGEDEDSQSQAPSEDDLSDVESDDSLDEVAEDLRIDTRCLMDLDPLIKAPVLDLEHNRPPQLAMMTEWIPYRPYCDKIMNRFPHAREQLILRLGKASYERYARCQEERERNSRGEANRNAETQDPVSGEVPATIADSGFRDSGIGSSSPAMSSYAATVMSYSQGEGRSVRIPSLPEEATKGKPFDCCACGKSVRITNNFSWKQHLILDLRPYMCLDISCSSEYTTFISRTDWISHLALEHGLAPAWKALDCPLCTEAIKGKTSIIDHLRRHLEEIALSALPGDAESDVETSSEASSLPGEDRVGDDVDHANCICGFSKSDGNLICCQDCDTWQHMACFYPDSLWGTHQIDSEHWCMDCKPRTLDRKRAASIQKARQEALDRDLISNRSTSIDNLSVRPNQSQLNNLVYPSHKRGPWSQTEDQILMELLANQRELNWVRIAQQLGSRSPKQCRNRYHQSLKPKLNHDPITPEEGLQIEKLVHEIGKRWAEIARRLHGRSDNAVKNWWMGSQNRRKRSIDAARHPTFPDPKP